MNQNLARPTTTLSSFGFYPRVNNHWRTTDIDCELFSLTIRWWPEHGRPCIWFRIGAFDLAFGWFELAEEETDETETETYPALIA